MDTRVWLLKEHGPVCAYCDRKFTASVMTLDHVAPRRGQTAYDRRDNLVLACPGCNTAKRDMAPLAFLLAARSRAAALLKYGSHLSPMLLDMVRSLVATDNARADAAAELAGTASESNGKAPTDWGHLLDDLDDGESPYKD